jgi:hypothetical protein
MAFEIASFEQRYRDARHPLSKFFFDTQHPDIDVGPATPPALARTKVAKMTDLTLQTRQFATC